jgi:hypothetical protein
MWFIIAAGWFAASVTLYAYLIKTAKEPANNDCMDCKLSDCSSCQSLATQSAAIKKAA